MTTKQIERKAEVLFWAYFQLLIKQYQNATSATNYITALTTLFNCNETIMNQIVLDCLLQSKPGPKKAEQFAYAGLAGYSAQEIADAYHVSSRTVYRHWGELPDINFTFTAAQRRELVKFMDALHEHRGLILC